MDVLCNCLPGLKILKEGNYNTVIHGKGELFLDMTMDLLRNVFTNCMIRVSDPTVYFCETVNQISSIINE